MLFVLVVPQGSTGASHVVTKVAGKSQTLKNQLKLAKCVSNENLHVCLDVVFHPEPCLRVLRQLVALNTTPNTSHLDLEKAE